MGLVIYQVFFISNLKKCLSLLESFSITAVICSVP